MFEQIPYGAFAPEIAEQALKESKEFFHLGALIARGDSEDRFRALASKSEVGKVMLEFQKSLPEGGWVEHRNCLKLLCTKVESYKDCSGFGSFPLFEAVA